MAKKMKKTMTTKQLDAAVAKLNEDKKIRLRGGRATAVIQDKTRYSKNDRRQNKRVDRAQ